MEALQYQVSPSISSTGFKQYSILEKTSELGGVLSTIEYRQQPKLLLSPVIFQQLILMVSLLLRKGSFLRAKVSTLRNR